MKLHSQKLGDGIHIKHGFAFIGEYFSDEGSYVVLTPGNFYEEGGFKSRPDKDRYYVGTFPSDYLLRRDDLIVAMTEQGPGLLGSSAIIPEDNKYLHNQRLGLIDKIDEDIFDKKYLYYLFNTRNVRGQINGSASGTKVRHTSPGRIYKVTAIVPDVVSQKYISSIIENYDRLIDNNRKKIQLLEESARLLFREWFVYFRFPGHKKVKIVDGMPGGWKKEKINKIVTFKRGVEPGSDNYLEKYEPGLFPFIRVSDLNTRDYGIFIDEQFVKGALLKREDIAISLDGSVGIVSIGLEGCYSTGIRKLVIKDKKINTAYLYFLMKSHYIQGIINAYAKGTTIQHAGEAIKHMSAVLPKQGLMDMYGNIAGPAISEMLVLMMQNQKLAQARDLLLPRLMNGTIQV